MTEAAMTAPPFDPIDPLRGRGACIVPRGVWHTARVHEPSEALHITRGAGTEHRPLAVSR